MLELLVLKKYADCTSQHVKWTSGARFKHVDVVSMNVCQICSHTTLLVKALCKAILCLAILSARYSNTF